jgi:hypothetical protein
MTKMLARIRRFFHCLLRFHRATTMWVDGRTTYIGCECYKVFYISKDRGDYEVMLEMCEKFHAEPPNG